MLIQKFSGKYCKNYKTIENAEKAVAKFAAEYNEPGNSVGQEIQKMRWLMSVDEDGRIIPVVINPNYTLTRWIADQGFAVMI